MSSVSWPWYFSCTMHVGMFLIKASYYNYIPSNMLFLGYEVFIQAEQIRVMMLYALPSFQNVYIFPFTAVVDENYVDISKKEISNNIVALDRFCIYSL